MPKLYSKAVEVTGQGMQYIEALFERFWHGFGPLLAVQDLEQLFPGASRQLLCFGGAFQVLRELIEGPVLFSRTSETTCCGPTWR